MRISVIKNIVPYKLTAELQAAGIPVKRVASLPGGLDIAINDDLVSQYEELINTVIEAHDGIDDIAVVEDGAKQRLRNIPAWATWTEEEALNWHDTNLSDTVIDGIGNLAEAKIILKKISTENRAIVRMLLALRDKIFPNLEI